MTIELFHVGEPLVAAMLARLASRRQLNRITCARTGISLAADLIQSGVEKPHRFLSDQATLRVEATSVTFQCDGVQRLDVLCAGSNGRGLALENKLGSMRLSASAFVDRFCSPCTSSGHGDPRIRGQMPALLDRKIELPRDVAAQATLTATIDGESWIVVEHWWLILRRKVLERWPLADLSLRYARIFAFDDLARLFGSAADFDDLVRSIIGNQFANRWHIDFGRL
jgi:hypothetical protein